MKKSLPGKILLGFGIITAVMISLFPFLWFILTSLKTQAEIRSIPPTWTASGGFHFYRSALNTYHLMDYILNSLLVAGTTTMITLIVSVPAAYALARLRLPAQTWFLGGLLSVSMFPQIAIAGPVWRILHRIGGLNTHWGLVLPYVTLTLPLTVWIIASFFKELPDEIEEAARVDGCTVWQTMTKVMMPLAMPGIFTAGILTFIYAWNEFFFALLILTQTGKQTLPVGIALFHGEYSIPWGEIAAASVISTLPLVLLVLLFQKRIVSGLSAGAIKG